MTINTSDFPGGEAQIRAIDAKNSDPIMTEIGEVVSIYNEDFSDKERDVLKKLLENGEIKNHNFSEQFNEVKTAIDAWSENARKICLSKIKKQDELFEALMLEN